MTPPLLTLNNLVISQTKSFLVDQFTISDEAGTPVGAIVQSTKFGDFFKGSRSLAIAATDPEGTPTEPVLIIEDPANFLHDTYEVYLPDVSAPLATIRKEWTFFKTKMTVTMQEFPDVEINGNFWDWDFTLNSEDQPIARVTAQWTGLGNAFLGKSTYHLSIAPGLAPMQHAAILGCAMSLDMLRTKQHQRND